MSDECKRLEAEINKGLTKHQAVNAAAGAGASMPKAKRSGKPTLKVRNSNKKETY